MKIPDMEWHPFAEKFPLLEGADWEAFKESLRNTHGNEQPITYRMVDGQKQGLDGRNRYRGCQELGIEPRMVEVTVADADVKDYILRRNVQRRHLTAEWRQQLVAELRADGQSIRGIAETLGVSKSTVHDDLQKSDVQTQSPESVGSEANPSPAAGVSGGQIYCRPCRVSGPKPNCPDCEQFRQQRASSGCASPEQQETNPHKVRGKDGKSYSSKKPKEREPGDDSESERQAAKPRKAAVAAIGVVTRFLNAIKLLAKHKAALEAIMEDIRAS